MSGISRGPLVAYVGSYRGNGSTGGGGISVLTVRQEADEVELVVTSRTDQPPEAGYLIHGARTGTLYAVNECKTDGRGPVEPGAAVHTFRVDPADGRLTAIGRLPSPGPFPTYLALDEAHGWLVTANHGSFEHVEQVEVDPDGTWRVRYVYDASTVVVYALAPDGPPDSIAHLEVLSGHGRDPNSSIQAAGHGQASAHAHCAVVDPTGQFLLVCDKGTDRILVYRLGIPLRLVSVLETGAETGPRHLAFDPADGTLYGTYEFSSEVVAFSFDQLTGGLEVLARCTSVAGPVGRTNEPADVRVHPGGRFVYVNNRGEDSVAWFTLDDGVLVRCGHVPLAVSPHPGLAARSLAFTPAGNLLLVADRPAGLVRAYLVNAMDGGLTPVAEAPVPEAAFVTVVQL